VNTETVYSGRSEAGVVMASTGQVNHYFTFPQEIEVGGKKIAETARGLCCCCLEATTETGVGDPMSGILLRKARREQSTVKSICRLKLSACMNKPNYLISCNLDLVKHLSPSFVRAPNVDYEGIPLDPDEIVDVPEFAHGLISV
jgi:hypothetical protein